MNVSRREMLLTGLGLMVTGCASTGSPIVNRPGPVWPTRSRPQSQTGIVSVSPPPERAPAATARTADSLAAIPRTRWTRSGPVRGRRLNRMNGINRITVHHEGWTTFWSSDNAATAARLEKIRRTHTRDRHWSDIGYHYVIDRAGRVWQARDLHYQGAHVRDHNEHNIGIMVLGNFDKQRPTKAQLATLTRSLRTLMQTHGVPARRVFTHQELNPTSCPGRNLQPPVNRIRAGGALA